MIGIQGELDLGTDVGSSLRETALTVAVQLQVACGYTPTALALAFGVPDASLETIAATSALQGELARLAGRDSLPTGPFREKLRSLADRHPVPLEELSAALKVKTGHVEEVIAGRGSVETTLANAIAGVDEKPLADAAHRYVNMAMMRMDAITNLALLRRLGLSESRIALAAQVPQGSIRHLMRADMHALKRLAELTPARACGARGQIGASFLLRQLTRLSAAAGGWAALVDLQVLPETELRALRSTKSNVSLATALDVFKIDPDEIPSTADLAVDSGLTSARLHSLNAMGYRTDLIEERTRVALINLPDRIPAQTARLVRAFYRRHHMIEGPCLRTLRAARTAQAPTPLSWDDPDTLEWPDGVTPTTPGAQDDALVDAMAVEIACDLSAPVPTLTSAEKWAAIDELIRRGESTSVIVTRTRTDRGAVCRRRRHLTSQG